MKFSSLDQYAASLREYLREHIPPEWVATSWSDVSTDERLVFERDLYASPWFGVWLPEFVGGAALDGAFRVAFEREMALAQVPDRIARVGQNLLLPTLLEFGTPEQLEEFGRPTVAGTLLWAQAFSEPEAGSDLAGVRARARQVDQGFSVSGQKTWTSLAHLADYSFCLVRTDLEASKHKGISMFLIDMRSPGLEYRPIDQIDGQHEFSEVFLEDVFVPSERVLGGVNEGWRLALRTLQHERTTANFARQIRFRADLGRLAGLLDQASERSPVLLSALGQSVAEGRALEALADAIPEKEQAGKDLSIDGAVAKLYWSEAHQRLAANGLHLAELQRSDSRGEMDDVRFWRSLYLSARAETIYAGTSQIQRDIIARRGLGLPR